MGKICTDVAWPVVVNKFITNNKLDKNVCCKLFLLSFVIGFDKTTWNDVLFYLAIRTSVVVTKTFRYFCYYEIMALR